MEPAIFAAGQTILASPRDGENSWINIHEDLNQKSDAAAGHFFASATALGPGWLRQQR
jgi:hypothetical protein